MLGPAVGIAIPVALLSLLLASFPFIASGHIGIPGVGLNNDMAMHLVDVDYLVDPSRPEPQSVINGYPLGPHSLVGTVVSVLGTQPLYGWLGLLVAVPVLTGITALGGLRELPGGRRLLAAVLVAFAYLAASVPRRRGLQGADRRDVPDRLRARVARDRAGAGGPDRDRDRPRADHGGDGPRLQPARRGLAGASPPASGWSRSWSGSGRRRVRRASASWSARSMPIVIPAADRPRPRLG